MTTRGKKQNTAKSAGKIKRIIGFVEEVDLDENTEGIRISTDDLDSYIVELDSRGKDLLDYIDQEVEVIGAVTRDGDGRRIIAVHSFEVLDYEDEDEYFDADEADLDFEDNSPESDFRRRPSFD